VRFGWTSNCQVFSENGATHSVKKTFRLKEGGSMKKTMLITGSLLALCLAAPAKADSVDTYTGNPYTTVSSGYTTANSITATLTFENPLPADASLAYGFGGLGTPTATDPLEAFVITDGAATLNLSDGFNIFLVTGSGGQIVAWFVGGCGSPCSSTINIDTQFGLPSPFATLGVDGSVQGSGGTVLAYNTDDPGKWSSVPEPSSLLMLGAGILGLAGLSIKKSLLTN
jgi:PEP-CTERM motif